MSTTTDDRADRLDTVIDKYVATPARDDAWLPGLIANPGQYVLVEQNWAGDTHWLTTHESPDAAARYHLGQEYCADYTVVELVDLDTGHPVAGRPEILWIGAEPATNPAGTAAVIQLAIERPDLMRIVAP